MVAVSDIHKKLLRRAKSAEEFALYLAGLEWDLVEPIVIESAEDFKSAPRWQDKLKPFQHQVGNLITFCRRLPVTLLADDVGLGKTISAGLVVSELVSRSRLSKVLVVCPKILGPQWESELISKFNLPAKFVTGRELLTADFEETGAVITTYNSARLYLDDIPEDRFQMLILDEAHKLRNLYGTDKPPKVAKCFQKALKERRFNFVLMLTATPIHNRLWDLYSLVDLLTVGRGHQNPFGTPGMFARKFIEGDKESARHLRAEAIEEFRSVVYGYMSRVRRGDARLYFPSRRVERRQVDPTQAEILLIKTIAEPIKQMNRLVQISILKALASSPEALNAQLKNMVRNGTAPADLSIAVNRIVETMPITAKLKGLGQLIGELKRQNPDKWRLVVFTGLRETQTTIQNFLEGYGLKVGIVNGDSGVRNQETIEQFRANPPQHRVIVSTEAGAEGLNLQVANILVNYDLPWNPMIVEQRIGRIQRLGSEYENIVVYNLTLRGTFEDYIVGRLMEKLQMASNAIGDIDSLLQGVDGNDDDQGEAFEERLLDLVLAALAGKDKEKAAKMEVESIEEAIDTLERERDNITDMLDGGDGSEYTGPRAPTLPANVRSMNVEQFTVSALRALGAKVTANPNDLFEVEEPHGRHFIRFKEVGASSLRSTLYNEASGVFHRLVDRFIATGLHSVEDVDIEPERAQEKIVVDWAAGFGGKVTKVATQSVSRHFDGAALVRVRATVLHDSYERLVEVLCRPDDHVHRNGMPALRLLTPNISDTEEVGLNLDKIAEAVSQDEGVAEFERFYLERREHEVRYASGDERKFKKLYDEFTPRFEAIVVALNGKVSRQVSSRVTYDLDSNLNFEGVIVAEPSTGIVLQSPLLATCAKTGKSVPQECLGKCEISGAKVLWNLLEKSTVSGRMALPEYIETCNISKKRCLSDELETSDETGQRVLNSLVRRCDVTGKLAEMELFGQCAFSGVAVLKSFLKISEVSTRLYRQDEEAVSAISGRKGHRNEFIACAETGRAVAYYEAEKCAESGDLVEPNVLRVCDETGSHVRRMYLGQCSVTNKVVLKRLLGASSVSGNALLPEFAIVSSTGNLCLPVEAIVCEWTGISTHPDDIGVCSLTGLNVCAIYLSEFDSSLIPLVELLNSGDEAFETNKFPALERALSEQLDGAKCRIIAGTVSATGYALAMCAETRAILGLRKRYYGFVFSYDRKEIIGEIAKGKKTRDGWVLAR